MIIKKYLLSQLMLGECTQTHIGRLATSTDCTKDGMASLLHLLRCKRVRLQQPAEKLITSYDTRTGAQLLRAIRFILERSHLQDSLNNDQSSMPLAGLWHTSAVRYMRKLSARRCFRSDSTRTLCYRTPITIGGQVEVTKR